MGPIEFPFRRYELESESLARFVGANPTPMQTRKVEEFVKGLAKELMPLLEEDEIEDKLTLEPLKVDLLCRPFLLSAAEEEGRAILFKSLSHLETIEKVDFYFRLESYFSRTFFPVLPKEGKKMIWDRVQDLTFVAESSSSYENDKIVRYIRMLSFYPVLQNLFSSFCREILSSDEARLSLFFQVIVPGLFPELASSENLCLSGGLLLYGPPHCGQDSIIHLLAKMLGEELVTCSLREDVFSKIRTLQKGVLYIRELSSFFPNVKEQGSQGVIEQDIQKFFTSFCDLIEEARRRGVLIFTSTNYPEKIRPMIFSPGRIDQAIYISPPDDKGRLIHLKKKISHFFGEQANVNLIRLSTLTLHYTLSELTHVVKVASERKARCAEVIDFHDLDMSCLEQEIASFHPQLERQSLEEFTNIKKKLFQSHTIVSQGSDLQEAESYVPSLVSGLQELFKSYFFNLLVLSCLLF